MIFQNTPFAYLMFSFLSKWPGCVMGLGILLGLSSAVAATVPLPAPVLLWPKGAPEAKGSTPGDQPAFYSFLPEAAKNTGGAVLIIPGGGLTSLAIEGEAVPLARWLNSRGLAAFVLRYRIQPYDRSVAVADVNRAVQTIRAQAADYKIAPQRIALLGLGTGAELAAEATYTSLAVQLNAADPVQKVSSRPNLLALVWGAALPGADAAPPPATFLVGSTSAGDQLSSMIDLWGMLRAARVPVDAHFFAKAEPQTKLALDNPPPESWPEMFYAWARFSGLLTEAPRLPLKGLVYLDGQPLAHGYVILTPLDDAGAGPVVGRVLNSTQGVPIGEFSLPANQGPTAGRYAVDVRENMTRWLSNSFTANLVNARGTPTPEQAYFGHHRVLDPSIDDQHIFTHVHPGDKEPYLLEIKPGADANLDLKIEVFSK